MHTEFPFYSGDEPNPGLRAFVEAYRTGTADCRDDEYRVAEFSRHIVTTKNSPIFSMHSYHLGKKPHDAVEAYVRHFTSKGDLVLDPFCGSGSTALAALIQGRRPIAIDASPAATFITRFYVSRTDPEDLAERFQRLCHQVAPEMEYLYRTICHRCNGPATIHYLIYSNVYPCPGCGRRVTLYEADTYDPSCCPHCLDQRGERHPIGARLKIMGNVPVAVNFSCHGRCKPRRVTRSLLGSREERRAFHDIDLKRIREIESAPVPYPYPAQFMMHETNPKVPWGDEWRPSRDFRRVSDLFTHRNLRAVAAFMAAAGRDDDLRAIITSGMFAVSRKAQHLDGGGGYIPGNWALPPVSKQRNVMESLNKVFKRTLKAKARLARMLRSQQVCISTQSAAALDQIPDCSVDYVFTDPPYAGSVQYAELNFVWECWLGLKTSWHDEEIIVNATRNKSLDDWARMMYAAVSECYRVLKPGRWLSICWHHANAETWHRLQEVFSTAGFLVGDLGHALSIDTGSNTYNQRISEKVVKRDLVINFCKPRDGERARTTPLGVHAEARFTARALRTISEYVKSNPGASKDRIYDHFISVMIRSSKLRAHRFESLLRQVAEPASDGSDGWMPKQEGCSPAPVSGEP